MLSVPGQLLVVCRLQKLEDGREAGPRRHLVGHGAGRHALDIDGAIMSLPERPIEGFRARNPIPPKLVEKLRNARVGFLTCEAVDGVRKGDSEDAIGERSEELRCHINSNDTSVAVRYDGDMTRRCSLLDDILPDVPPMFLGSFTLPHGDPHAVDYAVSIVCVEHNHGVAKPLRSPNVRKLRAFLERVIDYEPP